MPKYLVQANYATEGIKGLLKEGGSSRAANLEQTIKSMGGTIEAFYYAFGDTDVYVIADLPDNASVAALTLTIAATGTVTTRTIVLITPQEVDQAVKKHPSWRAPGQ